MAAKEIPLHVSASQIGARIPLLRVNKVGKLQWVSDEEHRRVVADQIPISFIRVKLDGKPPNVALGVSRSSFSGHHGKAKEQRGNLANL